MTDADQRDIQDLLSAPELVSVNRHDGSHGGDLWSILYVKPGEDVSCKTHDFIELASAARYVLREIRKTNLHQGGPLDRVIQRPEFRGLWRSRELTKDGTTEEGWSVTFALGNEMVEVAYEPTASLAAESALTHLESHT